MTKRKKISAARQKAIRTKLDPIFKRPGMWLAWAPINDAYVFMFGDSPIKMDAEPMFFQFLESAKAAAARHDLVVNPDMSVSVTEEARRKARNTDRSLNPIGDEPAAPSSPFVPAVIAVAIGGFLGWLASRSPLLAVMTVLPVVPP